QIGKITPTGEFTFYPIPNTAEQITRGHGNNLLFTEVGSNKVAKITTDGVVTESPEFRDSGPLGSLLGPLGRFGFWVTRLIESTELLVDPKLVDRRYGPNFHHSGR